MTWLQTYIINETGYARAPLRPRARMEPLSQRSSDAAVCLLSSIRDGKFNKG